MPYLYETHLHTKESSACGQESAARMAAAYKTRGYTGIIVTDHFFNGNCAVPAELPWESRVSLFCLGYELAKQEGDKIGLDVFFGFETRLAGAKFLVYGLDKDWLFSHPQIMDWDVKEQYEHIHADGGIVIHAHPFRYYKNNPDVPLYPDYIDGVETLNTNHRDSVCNEKAVSYAEKYAMPETSGSDAHSADMIAGGMLLAKRIERIEDFKSFVLNGGPYQLVGG